VLPGQAVTFTVDAYPQVNFTGKVRQVRLQPTVQQNVVSYTTIIEVPNEGGRLKPGMTATLNIEVERVDDVLRAPASAIRFRPSDEVLMAFNGTTEVPDGRGNQSPRGPGGPGAADGQSGAGGNESPRGLRTEGEQAARDEGRGGSGRGGNFGGGQGFSGRGGQGIAGRGGQGFGGRGGGGQRPRQGSGVGPATIWQLVDGRLQPVRVRAGLSDGTSVAILGGPLIEGQQIVTSVITATTAAAPQSTGSPLVPNMGRGRGGPGGGRGR
jgi:HlyD family secretion protein